MLIRLSTFYFVFLIPCFLTFSIGSYFRMSEQNKNIFTSFTFVIFKEYLVEWAIAMHGMYKSLLEMYYL